MSSLEELQALLMAYNRLQGPACTCGKTKGHAGWLECALRPPAKDPA